MAPKGILLISGIGPQAGAYAHLRLCQQAGKLWDVVEDHDYPLIDVVTLRLPASPATGVFASKANLQAAQDFFEKLARNPKKSRQVVFAACNSAQILFSQIDTLGLNLLSLPREGAKQIWRKKYKKVAIWASRKATEAQVHLQELAPAGIEGVYLGERYQKLLDVLIVKGMRGERNARTLQSFQTLARESHRLGCDVALIGCTELSYLLENKKIGIPYVDCLEAAIETALGMAQ